MKSRDDQIRPNEDQFNALKQLHDDIVNGINKFRFKISIPSVAVSPSVSFKILKPIKRQKNRLVNLIL